MLSEMEVREMRLYWRDQLAACDLEILKSPIRLVLTTIEDILEIKEGE